MVAKTCDICGGKTGVFNSFRCQDGTICKNCYKIVSGNYAATITKLTLSELKRLYIQNAQPLGIGEDGFETTRKIGSFLLLDDRNRKFCILNNQKLTHQSTRPEVFPYAALSGVRLISVPGYSAQQLSALAANKGSAVVIKKLAVRLDLKDAGSQEIVIIPTPVRTSTFAFRQGYKIAENIFDCLAHIA